MIHNPVIVIFWFVLEVIRNPDLLFRVVDEINDTRIPKEEEFDITKLCSKPSVPSVFASFFSGKRVTLLSQCK